MRGCVERDRNALLAPIWSSPPLWDHTHWGAEEMSPLWSVQILGNTGQRCFRPLSIEIGMQWYKAGKYEKYFESSNSLNTSLLFIVYLIIQLGIECSVGRIFPQNFEGIALLSSSFECCYWEVWCHSDSHHFACDLFCFFFPSMEV